MINWEENIILLVSVTKVQARFMRRVQIMKRAEWFLLFYVASDHHKYNYEEKTKCLFSWQEI